MGNLIGEHLAYPNSVPVKAGLRIVHLRKSVTITSSWTPEQVVNYHTTVGDNYHSTTNFENFPNNTIAVFWSWISINAPSNLSLYFWDLTASRFKWKARNWDGGSITGEIHFLVLGY